MKGLALISIAFAATLIPGPAPVKLAFGKKKTITITSTITAKNSPKEYVIDLKKGTKFNIKVTDLVKNGIVTNWNIADPNGDTFGQKGYEPWDGKVKITGKYSIQVGINNMASNGTSGKFKMVLSR